MCESGPFLPAVGLACFFFFFFFFCLFVNLSPFYLQLCLRFFFFSLFSFFLYFLLFSFVLFYFFLFSFCFLLFFFCLGVNLAPFYLQWGWRVFYSSLFS